MRTARCGRPTAGPASLRGFTLVELLTVLLVVALLALGAPRVLTWVSGLQVRLAAFEIVGALRSARSSAVRLGANVAVRFRVADDGRVSFTLYEDTDGDGVLNRDIVAGIDRRSGMPRTLRHFGLHARLGFPDGVRPRDPGDPRRRLDRLGDPVRFNRSDLASFGPLGGATPGTVYLTDGHSHLVAVRVYGRTGKIKIIRYDLTTETWR